MFVNEATSEYRISQVPTSHSALGQVQSAGMEEPRDDECNSDHTSLQSIVHLFLVPMDHKHHESKGYVCLIYSDSRNTHNATKGTR